MSENMYNTDRDDIYLKDIILKVRSFYREIVKYRKYVILASVVFAAYFLFKTLRKKPVFTATLTYMINTNEGSSLGSLKGILGQFGLSKGDKYNPDKIVALNKARTIVEKVIFQKANINGQEDFLANHIITYLDTLGRWAHIPWYKKFYKKKNPLKGFKFDNGDIKNFSTLENSALKNVYYFIAGDRNSASSGAMKCGYNEDSEILYIKTTTHNEKLSWEITNRLFDQLSDYYIKKTIEKQKKTYDIVKEKKDSILAELKKTEAELAAFKDRTYGAYNHRTTLRERELTRELHKLNLMYGEIIKNLEIADFSLKNKTPFVQVIDRPLLPLDSYKPSLIRSLILGIFTGAFLSIIFIVLRKIYREAME